MVTALGSISGSEAADSIRSLTGRRYRSERGNSRESTQRFARSMPATLSRGAAGESLSGFPFFWALKSPQTRDREIKEAASEVSHPCQARHNRHHDLADQLN